MGVYTSSQVEKFGDTPPIGVIQVQAFRAGQAGDQSPFFIDVRKRAFIPFTQQFFPEIESPGHGGAHVRPRVYPLAALRKAMEAAATAGNAAVAQQHVRHSCVAPARKWSSRLPTKFRQWIFAHPMVNDVLGLEQFELREVPIPELTPGQALVRVKLLNIHSGTRARMANGMTRLGDTDRSNYACAEVMQSRDPTFKEGDVIACQAGWQDFQIVSSGDASVGYGPPSELLKALNGTNSQWNYVFRPAMVKMWPPEVLMEMFGTSGMTAYFGMRECGPLMPKDCVAVAGTTGSVGSIAAQLARIAGCTV
ncbi:MAG: hypothetical protein QOJ84_160, partial [Bradyrhizobium sp.]|nr:hypothetical protein [Bradyrhizobium sp.]